MRERTPTLDGARIRLEPLTRGHLAGLEAVAFDDRIWRYMSTWVKNLDDLRGWVEAALLAEAAGTAMPWATILKAENRIIGSTRFMDLDTTHRTTELGSTWLAPEFHGMGLNAEAKLLQLRYGFEKLQLNRIALKTHH